MAKRSKQQPKSGPDVPPTGRAPAAISPPTKQPTLLAVSVVLFVLWFVFLLVTAIFG